MHGDGLVGVAALQSCAACCLQWHLQLAILAGNVVGLMPGAQAGLPVDSMVVATRGVLMGLPVGLLVGNLGAGDCGCMGHMICLLLLIWVLGTLGGTCTLGTHRMLWVSSRVMVSSNLLGFAY
jgi:hypothetical protein